MAQPARSGNALLGLGADPDGVGVVGGAALELIDEVGQPAYSFTPGNPFAVELHVAIAHPHPEIEAATEARPELPGGGRNAGWPLVRGQQHPRAEPQTLW